jgi:hypothetical protein
VAMPTKNTSVACPPNGILLGDVKGLSGE